jgi:hypothetical protein
MLLECISIRQGTNETRENGKHIFQIENPLSKYKIVEESGPVSRRTCQLSVGRLGEV